MFDACRRISESDDFERFIIALILVNAVTMGLETSPAFADDYGDAFFLVLWGSQFVFLGEIVLRLLAHGPRFGRFFHGFWNIFDFVIVVLSFVPAVGPFVVVARVFRLLRVLRVLSVSDELREFLSHTQKSFDLALYFGIVWSVLFYVFAISGIYLFGEAEPALFGTLGSSCRTLLYLSFLQNIAVVVDTLRSHDPAGAFVYLFTFASSTIVLLLNAIGAFTAHHMRREEGGA